MANFLVFNSWNILKKKIEYNIKCWVFERVSCLANRTISLILYFHLHNWNFPFFLWIVRLSPKKTKIHTQKQCVNIYGDCLTFIFSYGLNICMCTFEEFFVRDWECEFGWLEDKSISIDASALISRKIETTINRPFVKWHLISQDNQEFCY